MSSYTPITPSDDKFVASGTPYVEMLAPEQKKERARARVAMTPVEKNTDELAFQAALKAQRRDNDQKAVATRIAAQKSEHKTAVAAAAKDAAPKSKAEKKTDSQEAAAKKRAQKS